MKVTTLRLSTVTLRKGAVRTTLFLCVAFLFVSTLHATPIEYSLLLTLEGIRYPADGCRPLVVHSFGCDLTVGDHFVGLFLIDDALLSQTGIGLPGSINNFYLQIGTVVWDQAHPSDFAGFRGPTPTCIGYRCLGAPSPGFDVSGGRITGLEGGVYGRADIPFVDFFTARFNAYDGITGLFMSGALAPVPEPSSVLLIGTGLLGWLAVRINSRAITASNLRRYLEH